MFLLARPQVIGAKNLGRARAAAGDFESHLRCRFQFCQAALPARIRHKLAIATRGERWNCCARRVRIADGSADLRPRAVTLGCAAELVSAAASGRVPQKLCYAGEASIVATASSSSRRKAHARRQSQLVPLRSWPAANNLRIPCFRCGSMACLSSRSGKRFAAPGTIRCALASRCSLRRKPIRRRLLGRCRRRLRSSKRAPGKAEIYVAVEFHPRKL